jgi:hypothetical protein
LFHFIRNSISAFRYPFHHSESIVLTFFYFFDFSWWQTVCAVEDDAGGYRDTATSTSSTSSSATASTFCLAAVVPAGVGIGSSSEFIIFAVSAAPKSAALANPFDVTAVKWRNEDGSWTVTTGGWSRPVLPNHAELAAAE